MSETERQFREHGWTRNKSDSYRWDHPKYTSVWLRPETPEELMDMWITGFVAGKEASDG